MEKIMKLQELMEKLGIKECPEALYEIYENLDKTDDGAIYDPEYIKAIEDKFGILDNYYDLILAEALEFKKNPDLVLYARTVAAYNASVKTSQEARLIKLPALDGSPERDVFPTLVALAAVPDAVIAYKERGFDDAEIKKNVSNIHENLYVLDLLIGRPTLDQGHYNWVCHYLKAMIFDHKAFNFQPFEWNGAAIFLRNKSGEIIPMVYKGRYHESGSVLGSAGCEDETGAFDADFTETDDAFIGRLVHNCRVDKELTTLKKSEWECILREGDRVCNLHIPRSANISPDYVIESMREGLELTKRFYPEFNIKYIVCSSWLLEPKLVEILGEGAKVSSFVNRFLKFPILSYGTSCLGYVYPGYQSGPVESFPENTTLQRGIKKLMQEGGYIHGASGLVTELVD